MDEKSIPDDDYVQICVPCWYAWQTEAMHQVDGQIQVFTQLNID